MDWFIHALIAALMVFAYRIAPGLAVFVLFVVAFWWWREMEQAHRTYQRWVVPWHWTPHRLAEAVAPTIAALLAAVV